MASFVYNEGLKEIVDNTIDVDSDTCKLMLVDSSYSANKDDNFATTSAAGEISVTGYAGGFSGAGRKTVAVAVATNDTDDRVELTLNAGSDLTWSSLASGATIVAAVLYRHSGSDAASRLLAYFEFASSIATNGGDVTLSFNNAGAGGNIRLST